MTTRPMPAAASAVALAVAAALLLATAAHAGGVDPLQTQTCNEPPPLLLGVAPGGIQAQVTGKPLKPGGTVKTRGTNPTESPELDGFELFSQTSAFEFSTDLGTVAGWLTETLVQGADERCKPHLRLQVQQGCVSQVRLEGVVHKRKLVADHRDDLPGQVPSRSASRSPDGSVITFTLKAPLCAGQASRWLLLNTDVGAVERLPALRLVAPNGQASALQPFFVPLVP